MIILFRRVIPILACFAVKAPAQAGPSCAIEAAARQHKEFILGFGEGRSYDEAKAAALGDLMGFFGTEVVSNGRVQASSHDTDYEQDIRTKIKGFAQGQVVLHQCGNADAMQLIVGIRKPTIAAMVEERAAARDSWLTETVERYKGGREKGVALAPIPGKFEAMKSAQEQDRGVWRLIGRPVHAFPAYDEGQAADLAAILRRVPRPAFSIASTDAVATKTLPLVMQRLVAAGIDVRSDEAQELEKLIWSCNLDKGGATAGIVRFSVRCALDRAGLGVSPIEAQGVSPERNVESSASRKISEKLSQ